MLFLLPAGKPGQDQTFSKEYFESFLVLAGGVKVKQGLLLFYKLALGISVA